VNIALPRDPIPLKHHRYIIINDVKVSISDVSNIYTKGFVKCANDLAAPSGRNSRDGDLAAGGAGER
jgi:hypothetical protein